MSARATVRPEQHESAHPSDLEARELQLAYIWERCEAIQRLAVIVQDFAMLGDEAGVRYGLEKLTINLRDAAKTFKESPERRAA